MNKTMIALSCILSGLAGVVFTGIYAVWLSCREEAEQRRLEAWAREEYAKYTTAVLDWDAFNAEQDLALRVRKGVPQEQQAVDWGLSNLPPTHMGPPMARTADDGPY